MRNHASWGSMFDVMVVFLNREAYDKYKMSKEDFELYEESQKKDKKDKEKDKKEDKSDKKSEEKTDKKEILVEFDNIQDRIVRLTPNSSTLGDAIISNDGKKLYYLSSFESGYDLWTQDLREKSTKLLSKLNGKSLSMQTDKEGKNIFLLGSDKIQVMELSTEKLKPVSYKASMKLDLAQERNFMFDVVKKEIKERFYVKDLHPQNKLSVLRIPFSLPSIKDCYDCYFHPARFNRHLCRTARHGLSRYSRIGIDVRRRMAACLCRRLSDLRYKYSNFSLRCRRYRHGDGLCRRRIRGKIYGSQ